MSVSMTDFGDGTRLFELDAGGLRAAVTERGAALVTLHHPDGTNVVLGYDDAAGYRADGNHMGVIVGRYANRIAGGRLVLDGELWTLPRNEGANHLHGGPDGFGVRLWRADVDEAATAVCFTLDSPHLDQGYPGAVRATATYRLTDDGRLELTLAATADRPTVVNLTPHTYFDLAGARDVAAHRLRLHAGHYTPVKDAMIPTGEIAPVDGGSLDFRSPRDFPLGLDVNFVVDGVLGDLRDTAVVSDPVSGRTLRVQATAPGVQIYGGGGLGGRFAAHAGFCVEPQYFPDAPNQASFAVPRVAPGVPYCERISYSFD